MRSKFWGLPIGGGQEEEQDNKDKFQPDKNPSDCEEGASQNKSEIWFCPEVYEHSLYCMKNPTKH